MQALTRGSPHTPSSSVPAILPGPYSIPNVCLQHLLRLTPTGHQQRRCAASASPASTFAIECHMDKVAEKIGMNPIELRILNAYRDGDMKAHRRLAKNCALIESCQVAAQKANWTIRPEFAAMSSLLDGGGARAEIPQTIIDNEGQIGDRKRGVVVDAAPSKRGTISTKAPSTIAPVSASQAMGQDVKNIAGKPNLVPGVMPSSASPHPPHALTPSAPPGQPPATQPPAVASTPASAPSLYQPLPQTPALPSSNTSESVSSPPQPPETKTPPPSRERPSGEEPAAAPYRPSEPFSRGVRRPGASPFVSGTRRR